VSNACGTLWNVSARCAQDQHALVELGALPLLSSLTNSKHSTIATCAKAALKNLMGASSASLSSSPSQKQRGSHTPSLEARKRRHAFNNDSMLSLTETFESASSASEDENSEGEADRLLFQSPVLAGERYRGDLHERAAPKQPLQLSRSKRQVFVKESEMFSHDPDSYTCDRLLRDPRQHFDQLQNEQDPSCEGGERILLASSLQYHEASGREDEEREAIDDGPTDYSLKYQENDAVEVNKSIEEEEELGWSEAMAATALEHEDDVKLAYEDTTKTYYTEGTPCHISTATSMSDLRDQTQVMEYHKRASAKNQPSQIPNAVSDKTSLVADGRPCSGLDTPRVFYTEGTPAHWSRSASPLSLIALASRDASDFGARNVDKSAEEKGQAEASRSKETAPVARAPAAAPFNELETPLMGSRTSSLDSLASCPQQSVVDDYASYVPSHAPSGRVSPSMLPDSPCQTPPRPPSTKLSLACLAQDAATANEHAESNRNVEEEEIYNECLIQATLEMGMKRV
jgi:adenomatosis polyposis coli protein